MYIYIYMHYIYTGETAAHCGAGTRSRDSGEVAAGTRNTKNKQTKSEIHTKSALFL